ncbi:MAG: Allophanate hydrolase 2 subunit 1, partial [Mycobacterium sp.]|nr:Allophanate hydrolase 2 subunit 1 [Mycobacterium sp.]
MSATTFSRGDTRMAGTLRDYGDQALLVECADTAEVLAWTDVLTGADLPGVLDIVPASRTVLIKLARPAFQAPTRQRLSTMTINGHESATPPGGEADVVIDVTYDG